MIHYKIGSSHPAAHYFDITLTIPRPDPAGQKLRLPAWIPGSYMIRDFARNIIEINATCGEDKMTLTQLDKSSWLVETSFEPIEIKYRVYAWDLSVRSAHLDTTHGFFNGTSVFLEVVGQSDNPCEILIVRPAHEDCSDWRLATTLKRSAVVSYDNDFSFGLFEAENYQELIDHPVEMGSFTQFDFQACAVRHDVILSGKFNCDTERLKSDLIKICEQHIKMFGEPAPMPRYMFLVMVVGEGYGGLEHRSSTSLLCSRFDLPQPGQSELTDEYRSFIGLCSHEYFHSWNVKSIKPKQYESPDLSSETYTPLLWAFEGITSYYDDLALLRCGCISTTDYLELLGQVVTRIQRAPGRKRQSAAESSFNTWSKFYKQDENSVNAIVSYYAKGSLIALCIDLKIRQTTNDEKSLDDVMRQLWLNYLKTGSGVAEHEIQQIISELAGTDLAVFLNQLIYQTTELPLKELLSTVSIKLKFRTSSGQLDKGGKESSDLLSGSFGANLKEAEGGLQIISVIEDGSAQQAGFSAGDVIIAINDLRASMKSYQLWLKLSDPGSSHKLLAFRRDEVMIFNVTLEKPALDTAMLEIEDTANKSLISWLGEKPAF